MNGAVPLLSLCLHVVDRGIFIFTFTKIWASKSSDSDDYFFLARDTVSPVE
jgi:hypothetical protein